tara:strand:- start:559 stop:735 length:177 start_codon:yes stop_codon:yes gene_type:complete
MKSISIKLSSVEPTSEGPILVKTPYDEVRKRLAWFEDNLYFVTNRSEVVRYLEGANYA